jgi:hypothetical protein
MDEIRDAQIGQYRTYLKEASRPPSRGGNTSALHAHVLTIGDQDYSFLALGSQQWVYKADRVSFQFARNGKYLNINKESLHTVDRYGRPVVRGNRGNKPKLRSTPTRLPASRRERRD